MKSFLSQIKTTVESHPSSLKQVEGRISELVDKVDILQKTDEHREKIMKNSEMSL
jgi:acetolactate synthase small subunit